MLRIDAPQEKTLLLQDTPCAGDWSLEADPLPRRRASRRGLRPTRLEPQPEGIRLLRATLVVDLDDPSLAPIAEARAACKAWVKAGRTGSAEANAAEAFALLLRRLVVRDPARAHPGVYAATALIIQRRSERSPTGISSPRSSPKRRSRAPSLRREAAG